MQHPVSGAPALTNHLSAIERQLGPIEYREPSSLTAYANNPRIASVQAARRSILC